MNQLRAEELPQLSGRAYFDYAYRGPLPRRVRAALEAGFEQAAHGALTRPEQEETIARARAAVASLWSWPASSVAFTQNTTSAVATFAQSVRWNPGDRVLTHADEAASNVLPWRALERRGVDVHLLPSRDGRLDLEDVASAQRERPARVIALASVALDTGQRRDVAALARLAHDHGSLLAIDAAQSLGFLSCPLEDADAVFATARKGLLGPPGVGFLALRPGLAETLDVPSAGMRSRQGEAWRPGALRFEGGGVAAPLLAGVSPAIELYAQLGPLPVEAAVLERAASLAAALTAAGARVRLPGNGERSGIVPFVLPDAPPDLEARLRASGVALRVQGTEARASVHWPTTTDDEHALLRALAQYLC